MPERRITGLVGVYHADGGLRGEAAYVVGRLLGTAHCSLCDITHSLVRRKPAWDAMVRDLGLPFALVHLNEMPADVAAVVVWTGSPAVLATYDDQDPRVLLGPAELEACDGSLMAFEHALHAAMPTGER